jgi:leucyl-tRNA synthetase
VVQINGRKKIIISASKDATQKEIEELVKNNPKINRELTKKSIAKTIYIKNKLINFVILN